MNVQETHWAAKDQQLYEELAKAIPQIARTQIKLWQRRVDRHGEGKETTHTPHTFLFVVECLRYHRRADGVTAPIEPYETMTFLVAAENRRLAYDIATAELMAHGFSQFEWSMSAGRAPLILS